MRKTFVIALLMTLCALPGFGQAARFDYTAMTVSAQPGPSGFPQILAIPGAVINVCSSPANGVPCTNYATTYTDATQTTACPTNAQIVLPGTATCVSATDGQGNFGWWAPGGAQLVYTETVNGKIYGPYPVTMGSGAAGSNVVQTNPTGSQSITQPSGTNLTLPAATMASTPTAAGQVANKSYVDNSTYLNADQFGIVGDELLTRVTTTAGSSIVTAAAGQPTFYPTDVGKDIDIVGMGSIALQAVAANITAYISATQVQVSVTATTSLYATLAYYGTDNTAAINAAITAACNAQEGIFFPAGNYYTGPLEQLPSGCTAISYLKGIHIKGVGMFSSNIVERASATADLWDFANPNGNPISIEDMGFQRSSGYDPTVSGTMTNALLRFTNVSSLYVDHIWLEESPIGLEVDGGGNSIQITNSQAEQGPNGFVLNGVTGPVVLRGDSTYISSSQGFLIENSNAAGFAQTANVVLDDDNDYASTEGVIVTGSNNVQIKGFVEQAGATVNKIGIDVENSTNVQIESPNITTATALEGIKLAGSGAVAITDPIIANIGADVTAEATTAGIYIPSASGGGITISGAHISTIAGDCILSAAGITLSNSFLTSCNVPSGVVGLDAINLSGGSSIVSNSFFATGITTESAINVNGTANLSLVNSNFGTGFTNAIVNTTSGTFNACQNSSLSAGLTGSCTFGESGGIKAASAIIAGNITVGSCTLSGGGSCGSGSGGSGTVTSFAAPSGSWPSWLVPAVTAPTTTPSLAVTAAAIPINALQYDSISINSTPCTLGSSCTVSGGSSGISGLTNGYIPLAGSATTITANSHLDDGVTNAGTISSSEPIKVTGGTPGISTPTLTASTSVITPITVGSNTITLTGDAGAGTSPTIACTSGYNCTASSGTVSLTTGTSPTAASGIVTLTFTALPYSPSCTITGVHLVSASLGFFINSSTTTNFVVYSVTTPAASTAYEFSYVCGD